MINDLKAFICLLPVPTRLSTKMSRQRQSSQGDGGGRVFDELSVEQSDLHEEARNVLDLHVLRNRTTTHQPKPSFGRRMSQGPLDGRQDVSLHLDESRLLVRIATDAGEVLHSGNALLGVFKLGGNPQSSTPNQLIVLDVDDPTRNVSVNDVERQIKRLGSKPEGEVDLNKKVDKTGAHVPANFGLLIH